MRGEDTPEALKADITTLFQMNIDLTNEAERIRAALNEIREYTGATQPRPWTALSVIDQIARKALA